MQNMGLGLKNVIDVFHWVHYILFAFILFFSQNVELCCLIQMQKGQTGQMYCTTGYIPSVPFGANRHTTLCLLHIDGGSSKQGGGEKKDQKKKKRRWADRRGNSQKGTGQELCVWNLHHPPHSINSNTHAQMMHENPFMLQAGREDNAEKNGESDTKDGWKDKCISTGIVQPKTQWHHRAGKISVSVNNSFSVSQW